jgi:large subunit ribosomal protein L4
MTERKVSNTKIKQVKTKVSATAEKSPAKKGLTVDVLDISGKAVGKLELSEEVFGVKPNKNLVAQAVRVYLANQRLGSASTKTRGEVSGGGKKPWKQKGTGRARAGSIRSPLWRGGGVTHGPQPRDFGLKFPKKMRRKALACALSDKVLGNDLVVLNNIEFKEPKTKEAAAMLKNLNIDSKGLVASNEFGEKEVKALRNLKEIKLIKAVDLNTYEVVNSKKVLITKKGVEQVEKLLGE